MQIAVTVGVRAASTTWDLCLWPCVPRGSNRSSSTCPPGQGLAKARNAALAATTADVLAFVDDDVAVEPGWLAALQRAWATAPDDCGFIGGADRRALHRAAAALADRRAAGRARRGRRRAQLPRRQRLLPDRGAAGHPGLLAGPRPARAARLVLRGALRPARADRGGLEPRARARGACGADRRPRAAAPPRRAHVPRPLRSALGPDRRAAPAGGRRAGRRLERGRRRGRRAARRRRARHRARRAGRRERRRARGAAHRPPRAAARRHAYALPPLGARRRSRWCPGGCCAARRRGRSSCSTTASTSGPAR